MAKPREQVMVVSGRDPHEVSPAEDARRTKVSKVLSQAHKHWRTVMAAEAKLRENQMDDMRFVASEHWSASDKQDRIMDQRPCLTINKLPQFINQVVNAARQTKPSIEVRPVKDGADVKVAEVFQGIIRHLEQQSDAQTAYITAAEAQARIGRGYWRVETAFEDDDSFSQEIKITRVRNPFTIAMDPSTLAADGSDARYCFVVQDIPMDAYKAKYGKASFASLTEFSLQDERTQDWMPEGKVRVAEYWYVEETEQELLLVKFTDTGHEEVIKPEVIDQWPEEMQARIVVKRRRTVMVREVRCALINAIDILEGNDDKSAGELWPGKWIPIVPVIGQEIDLNGEIDYRGMVRDAKDAMRLYDYEVSALAEALALAPKAPYIGYTGQFEGHEDKWRQANRRNYPYLEVNPVSAGGQIAGFPQRQNFDPATASIGRAIEQANDDIKATMGLFDPSLGERGPAQSGKAITALQRQGEMANSNFLDNLARAIRFTGRILLDLIPKIYDVPQVMRIVGTDEKAKNVMVHSGHADDVPQTLPDGVKEIYDLSQGKFDVTVTIGPNQETRRQDTLNGLIQILQGNPQAFPLIGDLVVEHMDWPGHEVAAARLKKALPPALQDDAQDGPIPPQVAAKLQQADQQAQQMQQALQQARQELERLQQIVQSKTIETSSQENMKREELATRERIARLQAATTWLTQKLKTDGDTQAQQFEANLDAIELGMTHAHEHAMATRDHVQAQQLSAQDHQQGMQAAAQPPPTPPANTPPSEGLPA